LHLVAHRHADPSRPMIQSQNTHGRECNFRRGRNQACTRAPRL